MKSLVAVIILIVVVIGGYLLLSKPANAPVAEDTADAPMNPETNEKVDTSINGTKEIDTTASNAKWTGSKTIIKDYYDVGTVNIKSGNAVFAKGVLTGGQVTLDMTTIATTSTGKGADADTTSKMAGHLKSDAFFDVAKYPEAKFVITSATKESGNTYLLTGDLTIKGKTAVTSFPVEVSETTDGNVMISGTATIDRTVYDVRFGSTKFFQDLGDNVINDEFTLEFSVVTK